MSAPSQESAGLSKEDLGGRLLDRHDGQRRADRVRCALADVVRVVGLLGGVREQDVDHSLDLAFEPALRVCVRARVIAMRPSTAAFTRRCREFTRSRPDWPQRRRSRTITVAAGQGPDDMGWPISNLTCTSHAFVATHKPDRQERTGEGSGEPCFACPYGAGPAPTLSRKPSAS